MECPILLLQYSRLLLFQKTTINRFMSLACQVLRNSISLCPPIPQTVKAIGSIAVKLVTGRCCNSNNTH